MNIGIFTDTYLPEINGVAVSTKMLKDEFAKLGHNAYIITTKNPYRKEIEPGVYTLPSVPLVFLPSRRLGSLYSNKVARIMKKLKLDIVHTHSEFSIGFFGRINALFLDIPVVHTYHTIYKEYAHYISHGRFKNMTDKMVKSFTRAYCSGCSAVIVPTQKTYGLLEEYDIKNDKYIIPTGINLSKFNKNSYDTEEIKRLKGVYNIKENEKVLLFIGRVAKEKSIDVIVREFPQILEKNPKLKLVIVGDGPAKKDLAAMCEKLEITENVVFTGEVPWTSIALYYQLGDIFINASKSETQGITYIEAMASDLPVIARKDECLDGIIENKVSGFIFDDEKELPDLIKEIINDDDLLFNIRKNALLSIQKFYSENYAKSVLEVYENVLEKRKKTPAKYKIKVSRDSLLKVFRNKKS